VVCERRSQRGCSQMSQAEHDEGKRERPRCPRRRAVYNVKTESTQREGLNFNVDVAAVLKFVRVFTFAQKSCTCTPLFSKSHLESLILLLEAGGCVTCKIPIQLSACSLCSRANDAASASAGQAPTRVDGLRR
jgi:hypothetical protein